MAAMRWRIAGVRPVVPWSLTSSWSCARRAARFRMHRLEGPPESAFAEFLRVHAPLAPLAGVDRVLVHQAASVEAAWEAVRERWPAAAGPPPYWAVAWPGARALAGYLLEQPSVVRGRRVLEVGCGGAVAAIAALQAGARNALAADLDPLACLAAAANAASNGVRLGVRAGDVCACPTDGAWDVVLAADLWYERFGASRVTAWLRECAARGARVLIADVGRAYAPRAGLEWLQHVEVADPHGTEQGSRVQAWVATLSPTVRV